MKLRVITLTPESSARRRRRNATPRPMPRHVKITPRRSPLILSMNRCSNLMTSQRPSPSSRRYRRRWSSPSSTSARSLSFSNSSSSSSTPQSSPASDRPSSHLHRSPALSENAPQRSERPSSPAFTRSRLLLPIRKRTINSRKGKVIKRGKTSAIVITRQEARFLMRVKKRMVELWDAMWSTTKCMLKLD